MKETLHLDLLEVLVRHGVVPENIFRNEKIRMEYAKMKNEGTKLKYVKESLSAKYCISEKGLDSILYPKKETGDEKEKSKR